MSPLKDIIADAIDIPRDLILNDPRVTLIGHTRVVVENHRGIVEHAPTMVKIAYRAGYMDILGQKLILRSITQEEIIVEGHVSSISLTAVQGGAS